MLAALLLAAALPGGSAHVKASLLAETDAVHPGRPLLLGIRLEMQEGWHTYWKNPGDSGLPTRMTWRLPEGFSAGPIRWPAPERIASPPLMSYGYEDEVLLPVEIATPAALAVGEVELAGRVDWLECKEACRPGRAELSLRLPVRAGPPRPSGSAAAFAAARARLPRPAGDWRIEAHANPRTLLLSFRAPGPAPAEAYFFAGGPQVVDHAAPQSLAAPAREGSRLAIPRDPNASKALERIEGVLVAGVGGRTVSVEVDAPVTPRAEGSLPVGALAPPDSGGRSLGGQPLPARGPGHGPLGLALTGAFLGGLLLNLMPCVLPVLSLKVLGFVRQAGEPGRAWRHGLAFTLGVLVSFWALAGALLALRAGGAQAGWGFQLQSPPFVAFLAGLFFLLGLNLFGVFEVGASLSAAGNLARGASGLAASFWSGALATLVATPCTAPFMGSALGYALGQPVLTSLLVFTSLGLGMAAPYLVLSLRPGLLRFVPRPGPWMEAFRQLMGFLLMATVVALVWLFGEQVGPDGMAVLLAGMLTMALGAWVYGRGTVPGAGRRRRFVALALGGSLVAAGLLLGLRPASAANGSGASAPRADPGGPDAVGTSVPSGGGGFASEPFSAERLAELRGQGRPVLIDFTAAWCLTCQVNERVALRDREVRRRLAAGGVALLEADWTRYDPAIGAALASYGRQSVPLYVLYGRQPGAPPRLLPEVITPAVVLRALDETLPEDGPDLSRTTP
ncbi:MAG TPA: protein-disulfide reductase DsbD domain-containing protein [Vicinamibacteria bacterium]|nr:protein-disulfide reductase DsbD domain-containing protein [Vicinamibacteria bacterium]